MKNIFLLILLLLLSIHSYCEAPATVNKNEFANKPNAATDLSKYINSDENEEIT